MNRLLLSISFILSPVIAFPQSESALANVKPHSVTISVADMNQMVDWYEKKLGFEVVERKAMSDARITIVTLEKNRFFIELIKDGNATFGIQSRETPPRHTGAWGTTHLTFYTDDLRGIEEELAERDVKLEYKFLNEELRAKYIFVRDPEGNMIEFLQHLN